MPLLLSSELGSTTGVSLDQNAFWRLQMSAVLIGETPGIGLVIRYPPGQPTNMIALLRVPVTVAETLAEVQRLAEVALQGGTEDSDEERLTEAYQMFKNNPRTPSNAVLEAAIAEGKKLVRAYWELRRWLFDVRPEKEPLRIDTVENGLLVAYP